MPNRWTERPSETSSRQQYLFDICLLLYVKSWIPDDGRKDRPKYVECHSKIKQIWYICASSWFYYRNILRCTALWTSKMKTAFGQFVYANWSDIHSCFFIHHPQFVLVSKKTHFVLYRKHNSSDKMYLNLLGRVCGCWFHLLILSST